MRAHTASTQVWAPWSMPGTLLLESTFQSPQNRKTGTDASKIDLPPLGRIHPPASSSYVSIAAKCHHGHEGTFVRAMEITRSAQPEAAYSNILVSH